MSIFIIAAVILIVIGGFMLYNSGFDAGYEVGHSEGFEHANGQTLPPMDTEDSFEQEVERRLCEMALESERVPGALKETATNDRRYERRLA